MMLMSPDEVNFFYPSGHQSKTARYPLSALGEIDKDGEEQVIIKAISVEKSMFGQEQVITKAISVEKSMFGQEQVIIKALC